jgi:poly(U)-binding-splicing factor PUF60
MRTRAHSLTSTPSSLIKQTRDKAMADVNENGPSEGENRKRKRRGFDTGLEDMTEMEQTGEVFMPSTLPKLNSDQRYNLSQAKKYCNELTSNFQQQKQSEYQVQQMQTLQEAANQQRALLLMCRIYIGSINFELGEESVRAGFSAFGTIKTVNMSWDSATMKHKGYAFIEFETAEAAQMALEQMSGVIIGGRNIKVGRPNNVPQAAPIIAAIQESAAKFPRIYIASIHPDLTAKDVKSVFEAFGKIKKVELAPDSVPGKHRGWGFIDYENHKSASDAIASMNLFDLGGQFLRVGRALTPPLPLYPPNAGPVLPSLLTSAALGYSNNSNSASPPSSRNNHPSLCIVACQLHTHLLQQQ